MRWRAAIVLVVASLLAPVTPVDAHDAHDADDGTTTSTTSPDASTATTSTTAPPDPIIVDRQREIEQRIRELQEAVGEASSEEAALIRELSETQRILDERDAAVARIDGQLEAANARVAAAQADVNRLDGKYVALTGQVREMQRAIDVVEDDVAEIGAELYRRAGGTEAAAVTSLALDAETPEDLFAGTWYLGNAATAGRDRIDDLVDLKEEADQAREALEDQREEAKAARDVVARERAEVARLKAAQEQARREIVEAVERQEQVLGRIRTQKDQFNSEIAELRAESNSIADLLRNRQGGQTLVGGSGVLGIPVAAPITSGFGPRVHPILGTSRMHNGVDFGAGHGTPIGASADGEVVWAGPRGGYGNTVIIDHGNALATLYAHQSSVSVSTGQTVTRGQTIGFVGTTGLSTGPHLHWEARVRGTPVNPLQYT